MTPDLDAVRAMMEGVDAALSAPNAEGSHAEAATILRDLVPDLAATRAALAEAQGEVERLRSALFGAADDLDAAGRELSELENVLSRDPWRSEHAHQCAQGARDVILKGLTP